MTIVDSAQIAVHGFSHVGKVRQDNQDSIQTTWTDSKTAEYGHLYAIADGMGGYEHGGIASALALKTLFETFYSGKPGQVAQNLRNGVQSANLSVYQASQRMSAKMGTTLTAIGIFGTKAYVAHIGDSRAYMIRDGQPNLLTNDHTMVGELVKMKLLSPDKVRGHNQRSVLNRSLGIELFVQPDITQVEVRENDVIILCTDGVWSVVEDNDFAELTASSADTDVLSRNLVELALERDSDDNLSAIGLHIQQLAQHAASATNDVRGFGFGRLFRSRPSG